jgi:putative transposase
VAVAEGVHGGGIERLKKDKGKGPRAGKKRISDEVRLAIVRRTVKYEEVYLHAYDSVSEARASIGQYLDLYNRRRQHSILDGMTPDRAFFGYPMLPLRLAA